jgi:hypothetical protein
VNRHLLTTNRADHLETYIMRLMYDLSTEMKGVQSRNSMMV